MTCPFSIITPDGDSATSSNPPSVDLTLGLCAEGYSGVVDEFTTCLDNSPIDPAVGNREGEVTAVVDTPDDRENQTIVVPANTSADVVPLDQTQEAADAKLKATVLETIRDSLFSDPYIIDTATLLAIPVDDVMKWNGSRLVFFLKEDSFEDWKRRHEIGIGTNFNLHGKPREYSTDVFRGSADLKTSRAGHTITRYDCHRRGKKRQIPGRVPGGKSGKTRIRGQSIACGCTSNFNAILQPNTLVGGGKTANIYRIEYQPAHNHLLGDDASVGTLQKSKAIRDRIKAMLLQGMSISAITNQLTLDHAKFTRLLESGGSNSRFARDDIITYDDVYNILYTMMTTTMQRDEDPTVSAKSWMEDLINRGYFTYYDQEFGLFYGFSSPWQLDELNKWGNVFCLDVIPHACGNDTFLYTIVVKNTDTGSGIPCAFFLSRFSHATVIERWLRALKDKMDQLYAKEFMPTAVITDQGRREIKAIKAVWPLILRIFYCPWHDLYAWEQNFTPQMLGSGNLNTTGKDERKRKVRAELRSILYARTESDAEALINAFRNAWQVIAPDIVQYMNKNYFDSITERRRWMYCYREEISSPWTSTDNYIEPWHDALKKHLFKDTQQRRIDSVIHTIIHKMVPHCEQRSVQHKIHVGRMASNAKELLVAKNTALEYMDLKRAEDPQVAFLIPTTDLSVFQVKSFQSPHTMYEVRVDWTKGLVGHIVNCTCPIFVKTSKCCKHIALAMIELPHTEFSHAGYSESQDHSSIEDLPMGDDAPPPVAIANEQDPKVLFRQYVQEIQDVMDIMDDERPISNHEEVLSAMKKALELCQRHVPVLAEHSASNKRRR